MILDIITSDEELSCRQYLQKMGFAFFSIVLMEKAVHVHIEYGDGLAKFWMNPIALDSSYKMKAKDLKKARTILEVNSDQIRKELYDYFGIKN
ncbi:MAG: DUF4160 domain-containing protein [Pseudomonadota bacterium]